MAPSFQRKRKIDLSDGAAEDLAKKQATALDARRSSEINPWTGRAYTPRYNAILQTRLQLPVYQFQSKLLEAVAANQVVVVEGETGSGKT